MAAPRSKPVAIGEALKEYLARSGMGGLQYASKLASGWTKLVGSGIAAHSRPREIKGGRLTVIVDSSVWMNQLHLLSPDIIEKLNRGLGAETVRELRFRIGKISAEGARAGAKSGGPDKPRRRSLSSEELAEVERAAGSISDPELKARAKRLLTAAASTKRKA